MDSLGIDQEGRSNLAVSLAFAHMIRMVLSRTAIMLPDARLCGALALIVMASSLCGCQSPLRMEEFEASIGRLSQEDLIRQFGCLKKLRTGAEVWDFDFLSGGSRCVGYRVFFDETLRSIRWEPRPCQ